MQKYYELVNLQSSQPIGGQPKSKTKQTLLEDYANIIKNLNQLYTSKYGSGRYDINKGWGEQTGQPLSNWSDLQEQQGVGSYGKYITDLQNAELGLNAYNTLMQNKSREMAQANIIKEQAEKYLPQQLRMQGMGGVGSSESSLIGTGNIYQKQIGDIERATGDTVFDLLQSYAQAKQDSNISYATQQQNILKEYQSIIANQVSNLLNTTTKPEEMGKILDEYKAQLAPDDFKFFHKYIQTIKPQLEKDKEEENKAVGEEEHKIKSLINESEGFIKNISSRDPQQGVAILKRINKLLDSTEENPTLENYRSSLITLKQTIEQYLSNPDIQNQSQANKAEKWIREKKNLPQKEEEEIPKKSKSKDRSYGGGGGGVRAR